MPASFPIVEVIDIELNPALSIPLYLQLYNEIRARIINSRLAKGSRIPTSRQLAKDLGISRNTVITALNQLIAEGYMESKPGSGLYISEQLPEYFLQTARTQLTEKQQQRPIKKISQLAKQLDNLDAPAKLNNFAFRLGLPDLRQFPINTWRRLYDRHCQYFNSDLLGYQDIAGNLSLRQAVLEYLRSHRSVNCDVSQIIITSGTQQALDLCMRLLLNPGDSAAVEEPGYMGTKYAMLSAGAEICPIHVSADGIEIAELENMQKKPQLLCITPTHQYPLGNIMPVHKRMQLLDWAAANKVWIIEDDYDSEYHYDSRPIACMQGLDLYQQVIYLGSFSKVLFPGLRLGYMVLPRNLLTLFCRAKAEILGETSAINQAVTADFIRQGYFSHHLRKMRKLYKSKLDLLLALCQQNLSQWCRPHGQFAGMHVVLLFNDITEDNVIAKQITDQGFNVNPLSGYYWGKPKKFGLVLGFANANEYEIKCGLEVIKNTLQDFQAR